MYLAITVKNLAAATAILFAGTPANNDAAVVPDTFNFPEQVFLAQAEQTGKPVSFSADQADRGQDRYDKDCEECHGSDLKGGLNGGAPLRGLAFEEKYFDELPASILYSFMSSMMPPNDPGRYSEAVYADLMAFILKRNGVQEGAPLPSDFDALDALIMVK